MEALLGIPPARGGRSMITLADTDQSTLSALVDRSCQLYRDLSDHQRPLADCVIGSLFVTTSTRTRTAFTVGAARLGGTVIHYNSADLQVNTGESLADTGRIFSLMLDGLVARIAGSVDDLRQLSGQHRIPVISAMAAEEHPTQGVCDLATMKLHRGSLDGIKVLYVGEGNNTAVALAYGLSRVPRSSVTFLTPPGYGLPEQVLERAVRHAAAIGGSVTQRHSMDTPPEDVDVVYTTRWQTTGSSKSDHQWKETFRPFTVDHLLLERWPDSHFMHDLPAHRGEEVTSAVLDGPRSWAWSQARMKLSSAMAILEWALGR